MKAKPIMLRYIKVVQHLTKAERELYERVMKIREKYRPRKLPARKTRLY